MTRIEAEARAYKVESVLVTMARIKYLAQSRHLSMVDAAHLLLCKTERGTING